MKKDYQKQLSADLRNALDMLSEIERFNPERLRDMVVAIGGVHSAAAEKFKSGKRLGSHLRVVK